MPAVTPPPLITLPSRSTRAALGMAPNSFRLSRIDQWQAARLPGSKPAAADQRTGAHRGQVAGIGAQPPDLPHERFILQRWVQPLPRHAQHVAARDLRQRAQLGEVQAFRFDIRAVYRSDDDFRARHVAQKLQWAGEVELGDALIDGKYNHEWFRHDIRLIIVGLGHNSRPVFG